MAHMLADSLRRCISVGGRETGIRPAARASRQTGAAILAAIFLAVSPTFPSAGKRAPRVERTLLIALDAVPYAPVAQLTDPARGDDAIFDGFRGPVPLISSFPSTTSLALGGILGGIGLERSPGYEHRYYDLERNEIRGGGPFSYKKLLFPWRRFFDFETGGIVRKGIQLFRLEKASRQVVEDLVEAFAASEKPVFHAYVDLTDMIAHIDGPDGLGPFLRDLDRGLLDLRARHPELDLTVVLYSDHGIAGGDPLENVRRAVLRSLRREGFRRVRRLRQRNDVVFVPYGLVSSFVAFTRPGEEVAVARAIAGAEGVDFCVAGDRGGWKIQAGRGAARVLRRRGPRGDLYGYRALDGDPLGYGDLASGPGPDGEPAPWRPDRWWLEATREHHYPDALYRIPRAFDLVDYPASVVCSVAEGHMYGAATTHVASRFSPFGRLRFTHGALARGDSLGFLMSDDESWNPPPAARFDEALIPWGEPPISGGDRARSRCGRRPPPAAARTAARPCRTAPTARTRRWPRREWSPCRPPTPSTASAARRWSPSPRASATGSRAPDRDRGRRSGTARRSRGR
jgi:hypothetical protein